MEYIFIGEIKRMADTNPLAEYWSRVHARMGQETNRFRFGSEVEAASGGSSATFRASDSPEYVSRILTESPVSFIENYPDYVDELRSNFGLGGLSTNSDKQSDSNDGWLSGLYQDPLGIGGFTDYLVQKGVSIGVFIFAITLVLGGLFVLAMSTDTGKAIVKDAAKAAAA